MGRSRAAALALTLAAACSSTEPTPLGTLLISPGADTLLAGATSQFTARVVRGAGDTVVVTDVLWSSTAPDVASITPSGTVTAIRSGSTTIVALLGAERATASVAVQRHFVAAAVAVGPADVCALDAGGAAWCFGRNDNGELGVGIAGASRPTFTVPVFGGHTFRTIGVGAQHVCALGTDSRAWCWGAGEHNSGFAVGGTGFVWLDGSLVPVPADTLHSFSILAAGNETCAVSGAATYCWGGNFTSTLAQGFGGSPPTFVALAAGVDFQCGITGAAQAICWPPGGSGLRAPYFGAGVSRLTLGSGFLCALYPDGRGMCQGRDSTGQLGDNRSVPTSGAVDIAGDHVWAELAAGHVSTCGVARDGMAWCWGGNESGQLGTGDSTTSYAPKAVATPLAFRSISTASATIYGGSVHVTCAIATGGELYCWGAGWGPRPVAVTW